jgi:hypothetical protein
MKSGSEMGDGDRERDRDAPPTASSDFEDVADARREFFCLYDVDVRLRGLVDFVPPLRALSVALDTLRRGGEKEGRLCLLVVKAILQITSAFKVCLSVFMSLEGVTVMSHQNYLGLQLPGYLPNACHAFLIAKSRGLGIFSVGV